jgi:hypothetical protein
MIAPALTVMRVCSADDSAARVRSQPLKLLCIVLSMLEKRFVHVPTAEGVPPKRTTDGMTEK